MYLYLMHLLGFSILNLMSVSPTDAFFTWGSPPPKTATPRHASPSSAGHSDPHLVPLRRESVPVKRNGTVVSFKTSYSGIINVGRPEPQEFRVVFDTGSGHVVLPSVECQSAACLDHRRYNAKESGTAVPINLNGSPVLVGKLCDRARIGFGTGSVRGEFVHELVCLGPAVLAEVNPIKQPCANSFTVMAIEMSTQPFKNFGFDGIIGLGLKNLSLANQFSFFQMLTEGKQIQAPHFGFFLTDGEDNEESEIAFGGHNPARLLEPLAWTNVSRPELGYWQVEVLAVRVGTATMEFCRSGHCNAILDTGTSHLGIPNLYHEALSKMLTIPANNLLDCRLADLPTVEIEVPGFNITLYPESYMRRLPLREDVNVSSTDRVAKTAPGQDAGDSPHGDAAGTAASPSTNPGLRASNAQDPAPVTVPRYCRPRFMPVDLPKPLGPSMFILGEPVLHRYYTVFDWVVPRIGFGLSSSRQNLRDRTLMSGQISSRPNDIDVFLTQMGVNRSDRIAGDDKTMFIQMAVFVVSCSA